MIQLQDFLTHCTVAAEVEAGVEVGMGRLTDHIPEPKRCPGDRFCCDS